MTLNGHRSDMPMSTHYHHPSQAPPPAAFHPPPHDTHQHGGHSSPYDDYGPSPYPSVSFTKGPKRKRLAKACDSCHRSKRRCDGTEPCGNCQWANKQCSYTDQSGRRVAPPNTAGPSISRDPSHPPDLDPRSNPDCHVYPPPPPPSGPRYSSEMPPPPPRPFVYHEEPHYQPGSSSTFPSPVEHDASRKRMRTENGAPVVPGLPPVPVPVPVATASIGGPATQLDHGLIHELTNLFFAHCHMARGIIHKPVFSTALTQNRVPKYLLFAMCSVAAPFSRQEKIKKNPPRNAGTPFFQEARGLLFDGSGRLVQERSLATAQALCLLQLYDMMANETPPTPHGEYHSVALHVIEHLGVMFPDHARLTPTPSMEYVDHQMQLECLRRIFWHIHFMDLMFSTFTQQPLFTRPPDAKLALKLPLSETYFELAVTNILPEFLHLEPVKAPYSSEFGHLVRVMTIFHGIETALRNVDDHARHAELTMWADNLRKWQSALPEELEYRPERVEVQRTMLATPSSSGAWCYFHFHSIHASCEIALHEFRPRSSSQTHDAGLRLHDIVEFLGDGAKYSLIPASAAWTLLRYRGQDDERVQTWCGHVRDYFGLDIHRFATISQQQLGNSITVSNTLMPIASSSTAHSFLGNANLSSRRRDPGYASESATSVSSRDGSESPGIHSARVGDLSGSSSINNRRPPDVELGPSGARELPLDGFHESSGNVEERPSSRASSVSSTRQHLPSLKSQGLLAQGQSPHSSHPHRQRSSSHSPPTPSKGLPVGLSWLGGEGPSHPSH